MTPDALFDYLERKAIESQVIPHDPGNGKVAFFAIDNPYDLEEFENAVRNTLTFPAMLAEQNDGLLNDQTSNNYTNTLRSGFMILDKRRDNESIRNVRSRCFQIGFDLLTAIRKDQPNKIIIGKRVIFNINLAYIPVGPINTDYYGYQFEIEFIVNFTFHQNGNSNP